MTKLEVPWSGGDRDRASVVAELIFAPHDWKHRRVDSLRLNTGDRGRRRTSIDCTVPADGRLTWPIAGEGEQVVIPLGFLAKGPLRDFNIVDSDGRPLSILGLEDSAILSTQVLYYLLEDLDGVELTNEFKEALHDVVLADPHWLAGAPNLDELLYEGLHRGNQVLVSAQLDRISTNSASLIRDLFRGYVLFAITPRPTANRRTVVKFSSYWTTTLHPDDSRQPGPAGRFLWHVCSWVDEALARVGVRAIARPRDSFPMGPACRLLRYATWRVGVVLASLGIRSAELELPVLGAEDARSFHLELHVPAEIECHALTLPLSARHMTGILDEKVGPVAHVHGSYTFPWEADEEQVGFASLTTTSRGTTGVATLTSIATLLFFLLAKVLPGAMVTLQHASDPSAVLLTLPAVALTVFLGVREHELASVLLGPVRFVIGMCAALLALAATSLAWDLRESWLSAFWWFALFASGVSVLGLVAGTVQRYRRARDVVGGQV